MQTGDFTVQIFGRRGTVFGFAEITDILNCYSRDVSFLLEVKENKDILRRGALKIIPAMRFVPAHSMFSAIN